MIINLNEVPFSSYGSYLSFSRVGNDRKSGNNLYLKTVHGGVLSRVIFRIELTSEDKPVSFIEKACTGSLRLETECGFVEICICDPGLIRVSGKGIVFSFIIDEPGVFDNALPSTNDAWEVSVLSSGLKLMLTPLKGTLDVDAPWEEVMSRLRCRHI